MVTKRGKVCVWGGNKLGVLFCFVFLVVPVAYGSSQARDGSYTTAATGLLQCQCQILNLLHHKGTPGVWD